MKCLLSVGLIFLIAVSISSLPRYSGGGLGRGFAQEAHLSKPRPSLGVPGEGVTGAHLMARALRRPVAMVVLKDRLLVGNQRTGSVTIINPATNEIENEISVATQLSDLMALPDDGSVLALDEAAGEASVLSPVTGGLRVQERVPIGTSPVSASIWPGGKTCSIALLWAHRLALLDLHESTTKTNVKLIRTIDLPFAPRKQWISPDGKTLVVADSFGGTLALIDLPAGTIRGYRSIDGHNIRGIAASPDGKQVLISHSMLDPTLSTQRDHVFWGQLMGNVLRSVAADHLLSFDGRAPRDPKIPMPIAHWWLSPLGIANHGAGDPADVLVTPGGAVVVALSGVDEVVVRPTPSDAFWGVLVGRRPTALAMARDGRSVYVANTQDDSISVIDVPTISLTKTISLGPQPKLTAADRGESLFYEAKLSLDGWYSCNSCHTDGHTCGLLNDNHSDGSFGTPKRILSLLGAADTGPWAWNGSNATLEQQIHNSIEVTMQGKPEQVSDQQVADLIAYLHTLKPPPSLDAARGTLDAHTIARGRQVFDRLDCASCHKPPIYTSAKTYDVGLRDEAGLKKFNPPSLLGLSQRSTFFHDGRAKELSEVFTRWKHPDGQEMSNADLRDLLAFLRSL